jgi:hypothetical protein
MQIFIANYSQKESDRLKLGLHFMALAPLIITDAELGKYAISRYSRYLVISTGDFIQGMTSPPTSSGVATAAMELAMNAAQCKGKVFVVSGEGLEAAP